MLKTRAKVFKRDRGIFDEVAGRVEELRKHPVFSGLLGQSVKKVNGLYSQQLKSLHEFYDFQKALKKPKKNQEVQAYHPVRPQIADWWNELFTQDRWTSEELFVLEFFTICVVHDAMNQYKPIIPTGTLTEVVRDIWNCAYAVGGEADRGIILSDARLQMCLKHVSDRVQPVSSVSREDHQYRAVDTLTIFIEKCCDPAVKNIPSKVKEVQRHNRKKHFLPNPVGEWKRGMAKSYFRDELISVWSKVKNACPSAPDLKTDI